MGSTATVPNLKNGAGLEQMAGGNVPGDII